MENFKELVAFVANGDEENAVELTEKIIDNTDPVKIIDALTNMMRGLGEQFEKKEIFLAELLIASDALLAVMNIVEPYLKNDDNTKKKVVIIGTVAGDMHEIGKNIVGIVLKANGYNVIDLGSDVSVDEFICKAEETNADVIGLSSLMTTSMYEQKKLIELLKEQNSRDKYIVIVGGAPITQRWAEQIGADGYCEDAFKTISFLEKMNFNN